MIEMPVSISHIPTWSHTHSLSHPSLPKSFTPNLSPPAGNIDSSDLVSAFERYKRSSVDVGGNSTSGSSYSVMPLNSHVVPLGGGGNTTQSNNSSTKENNLYFQNQSNSLQKMMYSFPSTSSMNLSQQQYIFDGNDPLSAQNQMNGLQTLSTLSALPPLPAQPNLTNMSSLTSLPPMPVLSPSTSSLTSTPSTFSASPVNNNHNTQTIMSSPDDTNMDDNANSTDPSEMWTCYYGCGKSYKKSSGRSIRKHVVACFRAHWPGGEDLSEEQISTLIAQEQDKGQLVTGLRRWRMRQSRRAANQLPEHERWFCPWECGQFYRSTSSRSIQRHALQCPKRPLDGGDSSTTAPSTSSSSSSSYPSVAASASAMSSSASSTSIAVVSSSKISHKKSSSNNNSSSSSSSVSSIPPSRSSTTLPRNDTASAMAVSFSTPSKHTSSLVEKKENELISSSTATASNTPSTIVRPLPTAPTLYPESSASSFGRLTSENLLTDATKLSKVESSGSPFYSSFVNIPRVSSGGDGFFFTDPYTRQISQPFTPPLSWNRQVSQNNFSSLLQSPMLPLGPSHSRSASLFSVGNVDTNQIISTTPTMDSSLESIRSARRAVAVNLQQLLQSVLTNSDISHPIFTRSLLPTDLLLRLLYADLSSDRSDALIEELSNAISNSDRVGRLDSSMSLSMPSLNLTSSALSTATASFSKPMITNLHSASLVDMTMKGSSSPTLPTANELSNLPEQSSLSCLISASSLLNSSSYISTNNIMGQTLLLPTVLQNTGSNLSSTRITSDISGNAEPVSGTSITIESFGPNSSITSFSSYHTALNKSNNSTIASHNNNINNNNSNSLLKSNVSATKIPSKSLLWHCPNQCGVSLKLTSCKSIAKHRAACAGIMSNSTYNGNSHSRHAKFGSEDKNQANTNGTTSSPEKSSSLHKRKSTSTKYSKSRKLNNGTGIKV